MLANIPSTNRHHSSLSLLPITPPYHSSLITYYLSLIGEAEDSLALLVSEMDPTDAFYEDDGNAQAR